LEADAEIVALAADVLGALGIPGCSVSLGHVGFLKGMLGGLALPEEGDREVRVLLYRKDFVGLRSVLERYGVSPARADALARLPVLSGPDAIKEARQFAETPESRQVLRALEDLTGILDTYGVGDAVRVDLSIIRDFEYYTGIVFEGHTAALGFPLLGGGRYDRLLEGFGAPYPATGFAVRVDRVLASAAGEPAGGSDVAVGFVQGSRAEALRLAGALRARDLAVTVEILSRPWEAMAQEAIASGVPRAVLVAEGRAVVREGDAREGSIAIPDLLDRATDGRTSWIS
jgi:ATP phosphoribosyltransferase regulatory subunit